MSRVYVRDRKGARGIVVVEKLCSCAVSGDLNDLFDEGDFEELSERLRPYIDAGDDYARYLKCLYICEEEEEEEEDYFDLYHECCLSMLTSELNPWAMAELGLIYRFEKQEAGSNDIAEKLLCLAAAFGERRAQFYYGYDLDCEIPYQADLKDRLIKASAKQGFVRAKEYLTQGY